jgi:hypothetical protein
LWERRFLPLALECFRLGSGMFCIPFTTQNRKTIALWKFLLYFQREVDFILSRVSKNATKFLAEAVKE